MNKGQGRTKMVVTRVFDGKRTPQEAFVKVIINSENENRGLKMFANRNIIKGKSTCEATSPLKGEDYGE